MTAKATKKGYGSHIESPTPPKPIIRESPSPLKVSSSNVVEGVKIKKTVKEKSPEVQDEIEEEEDIDEEVVDEDFANDTLNVDIMFSDPKSNAVPEIEEVEGSKGREQEQVHKKL